MQFQTENILNSIDNVKKAADIGMTAGPGFILRNGMFYDVANIVDKKVKKTAASAGALEKWEVVMPEQAYYENKLFRFVFDVRLKGDLTSDYNRYSVYKGKPFNVEFTVSAAAIAATDATTALAEIVKTLKEGLDRNGYKDLTISYTGGTLEDTGKIIVEATNYSQVFDAVILQESKDTTTSSYSADIDFYTLKVGTIITASAEPFGSAWYITKNLRLPTSSNTRFMAINADERPIDGATYNQYSFDYSVLRDIQGMSVVGQQVTTRTTHVMYVKSDLVSAFETLLLTATGLTIV